MTKHDTDREQWIIDRVLWCLGKHSNAREICTTEDAIPEEYLDHLGSGKPIFAFISTREEWTILTTERIYSHHSVKLHSFPLQRNFEIKPQFENLEEEIAVQKQNLRFLDLKSGIWKKARIWSPPGSPCFAL